MISIWDGSFDDSNMSYTNFYKRGVYISANNNSATNFAFSGWGIRSYNNLETTADYRSYITQIVGINRK